MKGDIHVELDGLDKVLRRVKSLSPEVKSGVVKINKQYAEEIKAKQISRVPVAPDSGRTKESIRDEYEDDGLTAIVGPKKPGGYKAHWLEFGTVNMPAQPFIFVAYREVKDKYLSAQRSMLKGIMQ